MPNSPMTLLKGTLDVLLLKVLSWGPMHGYAVSRWIRQRTGDELIIEEGALYPALRRLEARGFVASEWKTSETGRDARYYRLTPAGRRELAAELGVWSRYVRAMALVLDGPRPAEAS